MTQKTFISRNIKETTLFAKEYVEKLLKSGDNCGKALVIALQGDLGAGKTTFSKAVAQILGVKKTVTSPTFVLQKSYKIKNIEGFTRLIHIDAYRLESGQELLTLGWKNVLCDPKNIVIIEWPERVAEVLPKETKKICFEFINETTRVLTIKG
jgi:tRNA threonylcarbamoyladenosine biosynthesis protein TsaE